jgi:hypothetical protein
MSSVRKPTSPQTDTSMTKITKASSQDGFHRGWEFSYAAEARKAASMLRKQAASSLPRVLPSGQQCAFNDVLGDLSPHLSADHRRKTIVKARPNAGICNFLRERL